MTSSDNPPTDPMKQAWGDVASGFTTLGRMMRDRYRAPDADSPPEDADAAPATDADDDGAREADAALRGAFDRLVAASREFGDRAADVAHDDDVKTQARQAASTLNQALAATADLIGAQIGGLFNKQSSAADPSPDVPASEPPADDPRQ
ncbi:MAG: hypothetical protein M3487_00030 [Actinomycetota bacterium]|nr:hypothetical protein [Acidimicrobiia bacterium]MDQ3468154.1 hypothetical protein [Actinomycetota bacterium]